MANPYQDIINRKTKKGMTTIDGQPIETDSNNPLLQAATFAKRRSITGDAQVDYQPPYNGPKPDSDEHYQDIADSLRKSRVSEPQIAAAIADIKKKRGCVGV